MPHSIDTDPYATGMVSYGEDETNATPTYDRWQYGLFKRFLGRKILEVGAGSGRITSILLQSANFDELVVTEPSPHFYGLLQERVKTTSNVKLLFATTGELISEYPSYFDTAFSVHVLEHIDNDLEGLREQLRLIHSGGRVIVLVPALQFLYSELDRSIGHFRRYNKRRFRTLVAELGNCQIEKMFYSNALGVLGSLYFSRIRKINYQESEANKKKFFRVYRFFSEHLVPWISFVESKIPVPLGLNLTIVLTKTDGVLP